MKRNNITRILILCLLAVLLSGNFKEIKAQNAYQLNAIKNISVSKAKILEKEGNYDAAIDVYNAILDKDPSNIQARNGLANVYSELFKIKAAEREYNRVLSQDPNNSDAHNGLGLTYYRSTTSSNMEIRENTSELYRKAAEEFKTAIANNPSNDEAIANLGMIYKQQGRIEEAEARFKEALSINPDNSDANYLLGSIMYDNGDIEGSIDSYRKAIAVDSKNSSAHYKLGEALISKGEYGQAIDSLQTSLYLNPISAPVHEKLGEAYKHQGNETAAIEEFKKAIAIKPEDTLPYLVIASIYEDRGDDELAIAELKSAIKNNPDFSEANLKIANLSLKTGKTDQSIQFYQKTLVDDPGNPDAQMGLSKAYFKKVLEDVSNGVVTPANRIIEAEKMIDQAIGVNPNDLELHFAALKIEKLSHKPDLTKEQLMQISTVTPTTIPQSLDKAYANFLLGDYSTANNIFRGIINQLKNSSDRLTVAETLIEYKDYDLAKEVYNIVLQNNPNDIQAQRGLNKIKQFKEESDEFLRLGLDLIKKKQLASGVDQLNKSIKSDPENVLAYYNLGEYYFKNSKKQLAYENYNKYLNLVNMDPKKYNSKNFKDQNQNVKKKIEKLSKDLKIK